MRIANILLALLFPIIGNAQVIKGIISDVNGKPVESAVVILQKSDSTYIDATTTDKNGEFIFKNGTYPYILFVQHMSYKNYSIKSEENNISLVLEEKEHYLEDVVVVARKPIVSIKDNGAVSFNIQQLIKNKPVTNALDLIGEIPGVQKTGSDYSIIGTIGTSIVINGRKSNMTASQIKDFYLQYLRNRCLKLRFSTVPPPNLV